MAPFPLKGNSFAMVALLHVTAIFIIFMSLAFTQMQRIRVKLA